MLSGRDEQRLRETVKRQEGAPLQRQQPIRRTRPILPLIGKAKADIAQNDPGKFTLQRFTPDALEDSDVEREAYALCEISEGATCELKRFQGEGSGGFWGATLCSGTSSTLEPGITYGCDGCQTSQLPKIKLSIEGLPSADLGEPFGPVGNGDNWAEKVNGSWDLQHVNDTFDTSGFTVTPCSPAIEIATNFPASDRQTAGQFPQSPLGIQLQGMDTWESSGFNVVTPRLAFNCRFVPLFVVAGSARIYAYEDPADRMTRDALGRIDCDEEYSSWTFPEPPASDDRRHTLWTWISQGTFTINKGGA